MKKRRANHLKWGVVLTYVSLFLNIGISLTYTPVMLRILGQSEHGLYSTVSSVMAWLSLLNLGFGAGYIRYYSKYKVKNDEAHIASINGLFLLLFGIIGTVALFCGFVIAHNLPLIFSDGMTEAEYAKAKVLAMVVTVDMAIGFPASVFSSMIRAQEKFIQVKVINLFQCVTTPLVTLPILLMGYGSVGMVLCTTIVDAIAYSMNIYYCFRKLHIKVRLKGNEKGIFKDMFSFSIFIAINSIINQFNTGLDKLFITRYVNTAAASVYTIGYSLHTYYSSFSGAVSSVFVPRIYRIVNECEEDKAQLKNRLTEQFVKLGRIQFFIQLLMLTGIIFFGKQFILLWAGQGYGNSYYIALLLAGSYTIPLIQSIGVEIQRAQNKHRIRTFAYAVLTIINVVLTIILCKKWGEIGAAIGTAVATIAVDWIFMNILYHKKLYINIFAFWKNILKAVPGLLIPVACGILIKKYLVLDTYWKLAPFILIYTAVYALSMWLVMNKEERALITEPIKKVTGKLKRSGKAS